MEEVQQKFIMDKKVTDNYYHKHAKNYIWVAIYL